MQEAIIKSCLPEDVYKVDIGVMDKVRAKIEKWCVPAVAVGLQPVELAHCGVEPYSLHSVAMDALFVPVLGRISKALSSCMCCCKSRLHASNCWMQREILGAENRLHQDKLCRSHRCLLHAPLEASDIPSMLSLRSKHSWPLGNAPPSFALLRTGTKTVGCPSATWATLMAWMRAPCEQMSSKPRSMTWASTELICKGSSAEAQGVATIVHESRELISLKQDALPWPHSRQCVSITCISSTDPATHAHSRDPSPAAPAGTPCAVCQGVSLSVQFTPRSAA
eukprot:scaffold81817_cov18-Tisochrysis_lutea.AAC.1